MEDIRNHLIETNVHRGVLVLNLVPEIYVDLMAVRRIVLPKLPKIMVLREDEFHHADSFGKFLSEYEQLDGAFACLSCLEDEIPVSGVCGSRK